MSRLTFTVTVLNLFGFTLGVAFTQGTTLSRYPYIQKPTTTSVHIAWKTEEASDSVVEYGLTPNLGVAVADSALVTLHGVEITGLEPNRTYYYRVASGGEVLSAVENFHTNNDTSHAAFSFMVFGDMGAGTADQFDLRDRMLTLEFDLAILTGDIIYESGEWQNFDPKHFVPYRDILKHTAFFPTLGNHDVETEDGAPYLANFFLPSNNPDSLENYYSFDYGKTHFICLDVVAVQKVNHTVKFDAASPQYLWLQQDLEAAMPWADFIVVFFHHPAFSTFRPHKPIQNTLVPLFEKYDVEMVFNGHDHFYERWLPVNGVTYVISGGGGRALHRPRSNPGVAYSESAFHVTLASIQDKMLRLKMIRTDGMVRDSAMVLSATLMQPEAVREQPTSHTIAVIAPFLKDRNRNGRAILEHKLSLETDWTNDGEMVSNFKQFTATIPDLTPNTEYDIRVTYQDADGLLGEPTQVIENILTTPFFSRPDTIFVNFAPTSIFVVAQFFGDGNNNAMAMLEHKLSSDAVWTEDGPMSRMASQPRFTLEIADILVDESYDFRISFQDSDGVVGENPFVMTGVRNTLFSHSTPIIVDGSRDDWNGISPAAEDTWLRDGLANEFIWRDARNDDQGDGGNAPNASDNPESYSYPTRTNIVGVEADLEEFRVAYDSENLYFLVDMVDSALTFFPYSIILVDKDGAASGSNSVGNGTEVDLADSHAWDYKIVLFNKKVIVTDAQGEDISTGATVAQDITQNLFETSIPISTIGAPTGNWSLAVLQTISSLPDNVLEVDAMPSLSRGGGGIDGTSDPDVYDLIGAPGANQFGDLNNYTDSTTTVLSNSWIKISFPGAPTGVEAGSPEDVPEPGSFQLFQNYPNPFNPETSIEYFLGVSGPVAISVYNVLGQRVKSLVNDYVQAGLHRVQWDGKDDSGRLVSSGVYVYQLRSGHFTQVKKLLLLR